MAISDAQFRIGVLAGGVVLVASITFLRFCGDVSLPPKPPAPSAIGTESQLMSKTAGSPSAFIEHLQRDAAAAGIAVPTIEDMSRKLTFRVEEARRVLDVGDAIVEVAGLKLRAVRAGDTLALEIENTTGADLGYQVVTQPVPNISACNSVRPLAFDALVIRARQKQTRVECAWRTGMALAISRVETVELPPMFAWYLAQVPPELVGIEERVARGHRGSPTKERCAPAIGQAVRSGLERGEIGWRDLADFYSRHRCQTYQFPLDYRALTRDGERAIPAAAGAM